MALRRRRKLSANIYSGPGNVCISERLRQLFLKAGVIWVEKKTVIRRIRG